MTLTSSKAAAEMPADAERTDAACLAIRRSTNGRYRGKQRLITRADLDRRTRAAQQFDAIATGISADLGGEERLSTVTRHLVEAFAGAAINVHDMNARLLLGQKVDLLEHSTAISTMVRLAQRIGIGRVARNVGPTLAELLREEQQPEVGNERTSDSPMGIAEAVNG